MKPCDLAHVIVDTTVQPKNITFPTDAKLLNRAREKLVPASSKHQEISADRPIDRMRKREAGKHQRKADIAEAWQRLAGRQASPLQNIAGEHQGEKYPGNSIRRFKMIRKSRGSDGKVQGWSD